MKFKIKDAQGNWQEEKSGYTPEEVGALPMTYCPYGVGDILTTKNNSSPASRWEGTVWAAVGTGRVLVGIDANDSDFDAVGKIGGEKKHAITLDELTAHGHVVQGGGAGSKIMEWSGSGTYGISLSYSGQQGNGNSMYKAINTGRSQPMNILQPYETVYRWERTA